MVKYDVIRNRYADVSSMQYAVLFFCLSQLALRSGRWPNLLFALALAKRPSLACALKTEEMEVGKEKKTTNVAVKLAYRTS